QEEHLNFVPTLRGILPPPIYISIFRFTNPAVCRLDLLHCPLVSFGSYTAVFNIPLLTKVYPPTSTPNGFAPITCVSSNSDICSSVNSRISFKTYSLCWPRIGAGL